MLLGACATNGGGSSSTTTEAQALHDGLAAYRRGELGKAEQLFASILETQPNNPFAHLNLGAVMGETNRRDEAIMHYKHAIDAGEGVVASQVLPGTAGGALGEVINERKSVADLARENLERLGA